MYNTYMVRVWSTLHASARFFEVEAVSLVIAAESAEYYIDDQHESVTTVDLIKSK